MSQRLISWTRVDLRDLRTYQQLFLYFIPIVTNLGFINILVVVVRLWWFRKHLKKLGTSLVCPKIVNFLTDLQVAPALLDAKRRAAPQTHDVDEDPKPAEPVQGQTMSTDMTGTTAVVKEEQPGSAPEGSSSSNQREDDGNGDDDDDDDEDFATPVESPPAASDAPGQRPGIHPRAASLAHVATREDYPTPRSRITFDPSADMHPNSDGALRIPGPRERDRGAPLLELTESRSVKADGEWLGQMGVV